MPDTPENGKRRFEDLATRVNVMDDKLDQHGEALARIETLLEVRPCIAHDTTLKRHSERLAVVEAGAQVSVARVAGMAGIVAAIVSAAGAWFTKGH
jgi:hypothetical protein